VVSGEYDCQFVLVKKLTAVLNARSGVIGVYYSLTKSITLVGEYIDTKAEAWNGNSATQKDFALGGIFAMLIRLELLTPEGDLLQAATYNRMFTMHGVIMVFFFLVPSIPATLGNFFSQYRRNTGLYQVIESPRGELGYYVVSDGTAKPYRVHMRGPSYANLQTLSKMCEGQLIADVVAAIGSIDVVLGDIDR